MTQGESVRETVISSPAVCQGGPGYGAFHTGYGASAKWLLRGWLLESGRLFFTQPV